MMNTSLVRNATRREGELPNCCCSRHDEKWDEHHREHSMRASKERKKWRHLVLHLTLQQRMRYLRRFVRLVIVRDVSVQLWSVSTHLYRESERVRERESERVSKHTYIHRDTKFTKSAREDVTKRRERTSGMNERATYVENESVCFAPRTFMISHSSSETRTLTSFFSPLLGRCISSFRMLLL